MDNKYFDDLKTFRESERKKNLPFTDWLVGDQQAESLARRAWYKCQLQKLIDLSGDPEAALAVWRQMENEGARPGEANLRRFKSLLIARDLLDRKVAARVQTGFVHPDVLLAEIGAAKALEDLRAARDKLIRDASDPHLARQIYNHSSNDLTWARLAEFAHDLEAAGLLPDGEKMISPVKQNKSRDPRMANK